METLGFIIEAVWRTMCEHWITTTVANKPKPVEMYVVRDHITIKFSDGGWIVAHVDNLDVKYAAISPVFSHQDDKIWKDRQEQYHDYHS